MGGTLQPQVSTASIASLRNGLGEGMGQELEEGFWGPSRHRHYTHGVGEARTRTPPSQHDDHISLLEEASGFA